jgi:Flp pilus assembly pilin Flp
MRVKENLTSHGQAVIEYLLVLVFVAILGVQVIQGLTSFLGTQFGSLADVMSSHLTVGVCERDCFYNGFTNGSQSGN